MNRFLLLAVVSADGYIGRRSGEPPQAWTSPEEQAAFRASMARVSWSFLGRLTHEIAPNPERRRVIFTRRVTAPLWTGPRQLLFNPKHGSLSDAMAMAKIAGTSAILGGTGVYDYFLEHRAIDEAEITVEPVTFGAGQSLFGARPWPKALASLGLDLISVERLNARGTVLRRYAKSRSPAR